MTKPAGVDDRCFFKALDLGHRDGRSSDMDIIGFRVKGVYIYIYKQKKAPFEGLTRVAYRARTVPWTLDGLSFGFRVQGTRNP